MAKFNLNDKVIPINKTTGSLLSDSWCWMMARKSNQPFLYFRSMGEDHACCSHDKQGTGDFFMLSDLIPYEEEFKEGQLVYVSDISIEDALKNQKARFFLGKTADDYLCYSCHYNVMPVLKSDSLEVVKWKHVVSIPEKQPITVQLNNAYSAVVSEEIKVGCQTFSIEKVKEVVDAYEKFNS